MESDLAEGIVRPILTAGDSLLATACTAIDPDDPNLAREMAGLAATLQDFRNQAA